MLVEFLKSVVNQVFLNMPSETVESLHVRLSDLFQHRIRLKNNDHSAWATILFTSALCIASYWSSISALSKNESHSLYINIVTLTLPLCPIMWFEVKLLVTLVTWLPQWRRRRNYHLDYVPSVGTSIFHRACSSLSDAFYLMFLIPLFLVQNFCAQYTVCFC